MALIFLLLLPQTLHAIDGFDRAKEFPNLLILRKYWQKNPDSIPESEVDRAETALNQGLASLLERATLPVSVNGKIQTVQIFPHLQKSLESSGQSAELMPLIRSLVGAYYNQLYNIYEKDPSHFDPVAAAEQIKRDTSLIPLSDLWGKGSDFDVLLGGLKPSSGNPSEKLTEIVNSARLSLNERFSKSPINRELLPLGDIKPYDYQIERSSLQGGSPIDFVAFNLKTRKLIDPPRFRGTVRDLIRGRRAYVRPLPNAGKVDYSLQPIRAMRPALELPWIQLDSESERMLIEDLNQSPRPSSKAKEQLEKLIRNSRFSGAHNVLGRASKGTAEFALAQRSKAMGRTVGAYLESYPIPPEGRPTGQLPKDFLLSKDQLRTMISSDAPYVYHGTPSATNVMAILRDNFLVSGSQIGKGAKIRGLYTSPHSDVASSYEENTGYTIRLKVKAEDHLNVVQEKTVEDSSFFRRLIQQTGSTDQAWQTLAQDHGVDAVVSRSGEFVILNAKAFELPRSSDLLYTIAQRVRKPTQSSKSRIEAYRRFEKLADYLQVAGLAAPETPEDLRVLKREVAEDLIKEMRMGRVAAGEAFRDLEVTDPASLRKVAQLLSQTSTQEAAASALTQLTTQDPVVTKALTQTLNNGTPLARKLSSVALLNSEAFDRETSVALLNYFGSHPLDIDGSPHNSSISRFFNSLNAKDAQIVSTVARASAFEPAMKWLVETKPALSEEDLLKLVERVGDVHHAKSRKLAAQAIQASDTRSPKVLQAISDKVSALAKTSAYTDALGLKTALASRDEYTYELGQYLRSLNHDARYDAILRNLEPRNSRDPVVLSELIQLSKSSDKETAKTALNLLRSSGSKDPGVVSVISSNRMKDSAENLTHRLTTQNVSDPAIVEKLLNRATHAQYFDQAAAIEDLIQLRTDDPRVLKLMIEYGSRHNFVDFAVTPPNRSRIREFISNIHSADEKVQIALAQALGSPIQNEAFHALENLQASGSLSNDALKALTHPNILFGHDPDAQKNAFRLLKEVKTPDHELVSQLKEDLKRFENYPRGQFGKRLLEDWNLKDVGHCMVDALRGL